MRPFKQRQRGLNAGELMVALAETVMVGGDYLVQLDQLRGDLVGVELRAVAALLTSDRASFITGQIILIDGSRLYQ